MRRVTLGLIAVTLLVLSPLVAVEAGVPLGGLTHAQAAAQARKALPPGPVTERWAVPGPFIVFRGGATDAVSPWNRIVWAVRFDGTFPPPSCGPVRVHDEPIRCPSDHTATVIIDYSTGDFVMASIEP